MQTLLGFVFGFVLAGSIGGAAIDRSGGDCQFEMRKGQIEARRRAVQRRFQRGLAWM
jgi:hypothetical protein